MSQVQGLPGFREMTPCSLGPTAASIHTDLQVATEPLLPTAGLSCGGGESKHFPDTPVCSDSSSAWDGVHHKREPGFNQEDQKPPQMLSSECCRDSEMRSVHIGSVAVEPRMGGFWTRERDPGRDGGNLRCQDIANTS